MIKEYHLYKTAKKTLKENNLVAGTGLNEGHLFDFSFLDTLDIAESEKEYIKAHALTYVTICTKEQMYGQAERFTAFEGIAYYNAHKVYNAKTYNRRYVIMELSKIRHSHGERTSIYDRYYNQNKAEITAESHTYEPYMDYEI